MVQIVDAFEDLPPQTLDFSVPRRNVINSPATVARCGQVFAYSVDQAALRLLQDLGTFPPLCFQSSEPTGGAELADQA